MRRLAGLVAVALATILGVVLLWRFRDAAVLFIFSLAVAAAVRPSINYLVEHGWPRGLAMAATYLLCLGVIGGLSYLAAGPLVGELQTGSDGLARVYEQFKSRPPDGPVFHLIAERLPALSDVYQAISSTQGVSLVNNALGLTMSVFDLVSKVVIVLVLSIYWGADQVHFERLWLSLLPAEHRSRARNVWRAIEAGVGAYVRSELIQSLLAGIILAVGFWALGMPIPLLLGLAGAIAWLLPLLGGVLALAPVIAAGLMVSPWLALAASIFTAAVFAGLELVVERRLLDRRRYNSILTIVMMVAMADALGIFGLIVAPPLAAALQIFWHELASQPATATQPAQAVPQVDQLKDRLRAAQQLVASLEEPVSPELDSLMQRLAALVEEVDATVGDDRTSTKSTGYPRLLALPARGGQG